MVRFSRPIRSLTLHLAVACSLLLSGSIVGAEQADVSDAPPVLPERPARTDARAQGVIDRHFEAIGGFRRYLSITSMITVARLRQGAYEAIITTARQTPYYYRVESSPAHDPESEVRVEGSNGDQLWYVDTARPDTGLVVEPWRYVQAYDFYGPFVDHERKEIVFAYQGKEVFRGREADILRAWYPDGTTEELFFSSESGILLGSRTPNPDNPAEPGILFLIANYRQVDGVYMPTEIHTVIGNRLLQTLTFEKIIPNFDFDSSLFDPPNL